jgi:hypothetical protein
MNRNIMFENDIRLCQISKNHFLCLKWKLAHHKIPEKMENTVCVAYVFFLKTTIQLVILIKLEI